MEQVPRTAPLLGLIGGGRVATALRLHLSRTGHAVRVWSRSDACSLSSALQACDTLLVAIKDDAFESFAAENSEFLASRRVVHFSGARSFSGWKGAHPLASFTSRPLSNEEFDSIPFVCEDGDEWFREAFPGLRNPTRSIASSHKARYHAACTLACSGVVSLHGLLGAELRRVGLNPTDAAALFTTTLNNLNDSRVNPRTGPWARNDRRVIDRHLQEIKGTPLEPLYRAFLSQSDNKGAP